MEVFVGVVVITFLLVAISAIADGIAARRERLQFEQDHVVPNVPTSRPLPQGSSPIVRHDSTIHNAINTPGDDDDSLITSIAIGAMTGSSVAGGMLGGSFIGGFIGAEIADTSSCSTSAYVDTSNDTCNTDTSTDNSSCDTSSDYSSSSDSSYDSGSSSDSGSSGGSDW